MNLASPNIWKAVEARFGSQAEIQAETPPELNGAVSLQKLKG